MKRKIKDISTSTTSPYIPDISYQLIFCFLDLRELTHIAQCSRDYKRIVTNQSFMNMYKNTEEVSLPVNNVNNRSWHLLIASPFQKAVQNIKFNYRYPLEIFNLFSQFTNLKKLNLYIECWNTLTDLSQFKKLESLIIKFHFRASVFFSGSIQSKIIADVRALPNFELLDVQDLFTYYGLDNFRSLCAQPGAPPKLRTIMSIEGDMKEKQQDEIFDLLQQLPSLYEIELIHCSNNLLPMSWAKWVKHIQFYEYEKIATSINHFDPFNQLESLNLNESYFWFDGELDQLIGANLATLKHLTIKGIFEISFKLISKCTELIVLNICECDNGILTSEFHLLYNCRKLKELRLHKVHNGVFKCDWFKMEDLSTEQQAALVIPSKVFPLLQVCEISS
jgi:hypothetical protein